MRFRSPRTAPLRSGKFRNRASPGATGPTILALCLFSTLTAAPGEFLKFHSPTFDQPFYRIQFPFVVKGDKVLIRGLELNGVDAGPFLPFRDGKNVTLSEPLGEGAYTLVLDYAWAPAKPYKIKLTYQAERARQPKTTEVSGVSPTEGGIPGGMEGFYRIYLVGEEAGIERHQELVTFTLVAPKHDLDPPNLAIFDIIFILEMLKEELKMRMKEVANLTDEELSRILVEDMPMTPEETVSKIATVEHVGLVCVDFADLLIQGDTTESAMAHIYRTYMLGAKAMHVTIVVLVQFSYSYTGGIPRPNHIRWTSLAQALAWAIIMLYNPNTNWFQETDDDDVLPRVKNHAYIIGWKFRGGFRIHAEDSPGAIRIPFIGSKGWMASKPWQVVSYKRWNTQESKTLILL